MSFIERFIKDCLKDVDRLFVIGDFNSPAFVGRPTYDAISTVLSNFTNRIDIG